MLIKCLPQFESLFYAVLLSNLKGYSIVLKTEKLNLFDVEDYIDIDVLNWKQLYDDHACRYGKIQWYEKNGPESRTFRQSVESHLKTHKSAVKTAMLIKSAIKFGIAHIPV